MKRVESSRLIFVDMLLSNLVASEEFTPFIDLIHVLTLGVLLTGSAPYTTTSSTRPVIWSTALTILPAMDWLIERLYLRLSTLDRVKELS